MSRTVLIALMLGALGANIVWTPAVARIEASDIGSECRDRAYSMWQRGRNGDGLDRQREFIVNSCMAGGGKF
jgi:hypothetical protein